MSFVLEALRGSPVALYLLDDDSPFVDHSGYGRAASAQFSTPEKSTGLVQGAESSTIFKDDIPGMFESPMFKQGKESVSFTLEAWVRSIEPDGLEQQVLGNQNNMDGITINGTNISFVTKYLTAPEARASYDIQVNRAVHVVGVHTRDKNSLYIDGVMVSETTLTEEQMNDQFMTTGPNLYSGETAGTQMLAMNGVTIYAGSLSAEEIARRFAVGRNITSYDEVSSSNGGVPIEVSLENAQTFANRVWDSEDEWSKTAEYTTVISDGQVTPHFVGGVSEASYWLDMVSLDTLSTSIYGIVLDWDGEGETVEVSLDGTTWSQVQRGIKIDIITEGFDPTDEILQVKISFPGGVTDDDSYVEYMSLVGILSDKSLHSDFRELTFSSSTPNGEYHQMEMNDNWGVFIDTGGSLTISEDKSTEATPARTLELWVNPLTAFTTSFTGDTYVNGELAAVPTGRWSLVHIVSASDVTTPITISGPAQVGHISVYDEPLSSNEVVSVYRENIGLSNFHADSTGMIEVTDSAPKPKIYAHDWAITSSG